MQLPTSFLFGLIVLSSLSEASPPSPLPARDFRQHGELQLKQITAAPWARDWNGATLSKVRRVEEKPDLAQPTGLPPVWHATVNGPGGKTGYLMWDATREGGLIEFSFDTSLTVDAPDARVIAGVPALQQFPVPGDGGTMVASGCVPTAAASLLGYWIANGHPQWGNAGRDTLKDLAKRLRARLDMTHFPDTDGFTPNGMALAGALPRDLAVAIQADANAHQVPIICRYLPFSIKDLKLEINAGRPVLLSCVVRVPHKPQLSWGHEVVAVGWARVGDTVFVGFLDNFYPTKNPDTIRWVRSDAFRSLVTVREIRRQ